MIYRRPSVKAVYPVGDLGLISVPEHLDPYNMLNEQEIYVRDPFSPGMTLRRMPLNEVTFKIGATHFFSKDGHELGADWKGPEERQKRQLLYNFSIAFWPVAAATFQRLLSVPKRDHGLNPNITPDMGLVVSPPKRKIDGPKVKPRPGPPTPGGT